MSRCLLLIALLVCASTALAEEKILRFHADIDVYRDGSLRVTEEITVRAEGRQIRRGIYRDFPTRYRDRWGNRVQVSFTPLEVLRDGEPEPWFTEQLSNGVRLNTGDDSFLPTPLETTYTLRYRTHRQLGFFDEHDELYWNVTGNGWAFAIDEASATVILPEAVTAQEVQLHYYTGPQGSRAQNARARVTDNGTVQFHTTQTLAPREGLTIAVSFPKGLVEEPTTGDRVRDFVRDNRGQGLILLALLGIGIFYYLQWRQKGRDPAAGPVFARYHPPEGFSPAELCYLRKGYYHERCFSSDLVQLAVKGQLGIHHDGPEKKSWLGTDKETWILEKNRDAPQAELTPSESALLDKLFLTSSRVELEQASHEIIQRARSAHKDALKQRLKPRYLVDNLGISVTGGLLSAAAIVGALVLAPHKTAVSLWVPLLALVVLNVLFWIWMRRPTAEGAELLDHTRGLEEYMTVASKEDIGRLQLQRQGEPPMNPERFEQLLPYAMALEVETAWTDRFIQAAGIAGTAAASNHLHWYHGSMAHGGLSSLGSQLGEGLSSQISSAATPPGGTSGAGGGGFSGGGGGGGGGGGR